MENELKIETIGIPHANKLSNNERDAFCSTLLISVLEYEKSNKEE